MSHGIPNYGWIYFGSDAGSSSRRRDRDSVYINLPVYNGSSSSQMSYMNDTGTSNPSPMSLVGEGSATVIYWNQKQYYSNY